MDCPFCNKSAIEKQIIYETGSENVIHNIHPLTIGQCIVVPKRHVSGIRALKDEEIASLFNTVKFVSEKLKENLSPEGFNYGINEGARAGRTIEHLHVHILPRYKIDKVKDYHVFHREKNVDDLSDKEMSEAASKIRKFF